MRLRPSHIKLNHVAVLLALIGLLAIPRGLVLCVGDSGHTSIESVLEISPCQPASDDLRFETTPVESCSDTPLTTGSFQGPKTLEIEFDSTLLGADARPPCPSHDAIVLIHASGDHPVASSLRLRVHRTVVLLV